MMQKIKFRIHQIILLFFIFTSSICFANNSSLRVSALGGLGQALLTSKDGLESFESPFGFSINIDYTMNSRFDLGAEHMRTLSVNGSTVGISGFSLKYFFWFPHPQAVDENTESLERPVLKFNAYTPYVGGSFGVAQGGVLDTKINSVGLYLNLKGGIDYPVSTSWGLRAEGNIGLSSGTGQLQFINGLIGFYHFL